MNMGHLWGSKYNAANRPISGEIMECSTCFNSLGLPFCQGSCPLSFIYQGWARAMGLQPSMVEWINWGKTMENYSNHKFAVFPAAVPVGFQSLGLVAKPENQNGPRTELGTPSVGLQRWITVIWCLTEILLTSTSWNQGSLLLSKGLASEWWSDLHCNGVLPRPRMKMTSGSPRFWLGIATTENTTNLCAGFCFPCFLVGGCLK